MRVHQVQVIAKATCAAYTAVFDRIEGWPDWISGLISADCSDAAQRVKSHIYVLYALGENDFDVIIDVTEHQPCKRTVHQWSGMISGTVTWTVQSSGPNLTLHVESKLQIGESSMPDSAVRFESERKLVESFQTSLEALKVRIEG